MVSYKKIPKGSLIRKYARLSLIFPGKSNPKKRKKEKGVPLIVTCHPSLDCLGKIIRENLYLLCMND